ncbi:hypothetical protein N1E18_09845 [Pseudomonas aeruginosa]|nr:hypothetical protein [Pseudomonas aeruginosa]MCS9725777.1 hypothetical protein [Pseudomonas aeruginosa]
MTTKNATASEGLIALRDALRAGMPVVALLGQAAGWINKPDPVLQSALRHAGRDGVAWTDLLNREPLEANFYHWIAERYARRGPSDALSAIADIPFSAIFTSSIDPGLPNLFSTNGREPEPVLMGSPVPTVLRSTRRPPIFYLFGRAGVGVAELDPPTSRQSLAQRRLQQSSAMLLNVRESATALGLIIVDGYYPSGDWLRAEELLACLSDAPKGGVVWFGSEPEFSDDDADTFRELVKSGVILRENGGLDQAYTHLLATEEITPVKAWDEPEIVSLQDGRPFVVPPQLRLLTEATASIVDNSWTGFLPPFTAAVESSAFYSFHSSNIGSRALVEGIRRNYAIQRDFETDLFAKVEKALARHHEQTGAIILHGQSGVGKSIAIGRLAITAREKTKVAVLLSAGPRIPQAAEVSPFLEAVDRTGSITLLLVDSNSSVQRYDDLLSALRSGGRKVVVVGTTYRLEEDGRRFVHAPPTLSKTEKASLLELSNRHNLTDLGRVIDSDHALAKFYWGLPASRGGIADGLGREARYVETDLRLRGTRPRPTTGLGALGIALVAAGYSEPIAQFFPDALPTTGFDLDSPAAKVIDYVMVVSRLYRSVPINLLLRTVLSSTSGESASPISLDTLRELFEGQDLFRWERSGHAQNELLISSRLQIEAELVCNRRLGSPDREANRIIELISHAYRAGAEDNEEAHFVADIVYALGPDGPTRDRYKNSYLEIGRSLTTLRERHGIMNARLMLQESTLRRHFIRTIQDIDAQSKAIVLEEATRAVNDALTAIDLSGENRLYAARRTREHLLTERAATYGFLATDSAQREENPNVVWASYKAARDAARLAAGRVFSYQPLDISLWVPMRVLSESSHLNSSQKAELLADIRSTLDLVDPTTLGPEQAEMFRRQEIFAAEVLEDTELSETAFAALDAAGSAVGFYLKARALAPTRPADGEVATDNDKQAAERAAAYLSNVFAKISHDPRSLQLLISMEWIKATKHWLFRGLRQPLPSTIESRERIRSLVSELRSTDEEAFSPQFRYIEAVLRWLTGDEQAAITLWRTLARDTDFVEARRIANRHTITAADGSPILYTGVVVRAIGQGRWAVRISDLEREVDLLQSDFSGTELSVGRTVRNFAVSFSYRGPIADPFHRREN